MQEQIPAVFKAEFHCVFGSFEALFFALGPTESLFFCFSPVSEWNDVILNNI